MIKYWSVCSRSINLIHVQRHSVKLYIYSSMQLAKPFISALINTTKRQDIVNLHQVHITIIRSQLIQNERTVAYNISLELRR